MPDPTPLSPPVTRCTARALLLGERIDTAGLERSDVISTVPLAFRVGAAGYAVLFRYGGVVLIGLSPIEEDEVLRGIRPRVPDVLWDRGDLERLFARLEDEYELKERENALRQKLEVIEETTCALTDIIDTERSA